MRAKLVPAAVTANPLLFGGLAVAAIVGVLYFKSNAAPVEGSSDNTNYSGLGFSAPVGYGMVSANNSSGGGYFNSVTSAPTPDAATTYAPANPTDIPVVSSSNNNIDALLAAAAIKDLRDYTLQLETIKQSSDIFNAQANISVMSMRSNEYIASLMATSGIAQSIIASGKPLVQGGITGPNGVDFDFNILQVQTWNKSDKNNTINKQAIAQFGAYVPPAPVVQPMTVNNANAFSYANNSYNNDNYAPYNTQVSDYSPPADYTPPATVMPVYSSGSGGGRAENNVREN